MLSPKEFPSGSICFKVMKIAITGGIGEGKSAVLEILKRNGFEVASADQVAGELFNLNSVQEELAKILDLPVPISPKILRFAIENDATIRRRVNRLMHPQVVSIIESSKATFIEIPILLEVVIQPLFDSVWVVSTDEAVQKSRISSRQLGESNRHIQNQLSGKARRAFADAVIWNNGTLTQLEMQVLNLCKQFN
jgi:dephospho-CoA kinase